MSGIFDRMNNPAVPGETKSLSPAFLSGVLILKNSGLRNEAQLLADINAQLDAGNPLDAEAQQDLIDVAGYIAAGTGEAGQVSRLHRLESAAGIWETGQGSITEAEARTITGVTYTFGT